MAINATNESKPKQLIPIGNYIARCYSMIHLGTCIENIMGEDKVMNKVIITWELPNEMRIFNEDKGEQPLAISKQYTLSMHEKSNLRKDLESWRGKSFVEAEAKCFDITKLLELPCMLNIIHKQSKSGVTYNAISGITNIPKGIECPPLINKRFEFDFNTGFDLEVLDKLPDFIKDRIKKSDEYKAIMNPENTQIESDDDLPPSEKLTIDESPIKNESEEPIF